MGATTTFKAYRCPECNAPLTVDEAAASVQCTYCGHTFAVRRARTEPAPQPAPQPAMSSSPSSSRSAARWLGGLLPVAIIGFVAFMLNRQGVLSTMTGALGGGGRALQWDAVAPGPLVADVDGDGFEDFVGRGRNINPDELWLVAYGGADLRSRWRVGPLGDWNARNAVRFAIAGRRVLVTDGRQTARVIDLGSGKPLGSVPLSDGATEVCADPSAPRFFVVSADGEQLFVEGDPPARKSGTRPSWCKKPDPFAFASPAARRRIAAGDPLGEHGDTPRAPAVRGFRSEYVLRDGGRAVAVGEKHPGTPQPMIAGFAVGRAAADWSRPIATIDPADVDERAVEVAALERGTLYAYYGLSSLRGGRLVAVDANSGATRWDIVVPNSATGSAPETIVVGARRLYLPHWTWLDVIDAATGAVIGTVGR